MQQALEQSEGYREMMSKQAKALVHGFRGLRMSGEEVKLESAKPTPAVDEGMKNKKPYTKK